MSAALAKQQTAAALDIPRLSDEQLAQLTERGNLRPAVDCMATVVACVAVVATYHFIGPLAFAGTWLAIGALQHRISIIQHEANHYLLFRNRKWNDWIGAVFAYSIGFTMSYRRIHYRHHARLGDSDDPDLPNYIDYPQTALGFAADILRNASGYAAAMQFLRQVLGAGRESGEQASAKIHAGAGENPLGIVVAQALIFAAFALTVGWLDYFLLWALPLATAAKTLAHFRNVVEHAHTRSTHSPLRYRTLESPAIENFFFAPLHFNYHAEHHFYPQIPYYNLPRAHEILKKQKAYAQCVCLDRSYLRFLAREAVR